MPGGKRNECVREEQKEEKKKKVHKKISKFFFSFKHSLTSFETEGSTFLCLAGGCASDIVAFGLVPPLLKNQLFPSFAPGPLSSRSFSPDPARISDSSFRGFQPQISMKPENKKLETKITRRRGESKQKQKQKQKRGRSRDAGRVTKGNGGGDSEIVR